MHIDAMTHEGAHDWLERDSPKGLDDVRLVADNMAAEENGMDLRTRERRDGGPSDERLSCATDNPGRPNRPKAKHPIAGCKGPDDKVSSTPPVNAQSDCTVGDMGKESTDRETASSAHGDLFPKATTSGIGA